MFLYPTDYITTANNQNEGMSEDTNNHFWSNNQKCFLVWSKND